MALLNPCGHCGNVHESSIACQYPTPPAPLTLEEQIAAGVEKALAAQNKKSKKKPSDTISDTATDPNTGTTDPNAAA